MWTEKYKPKDLKGFVDHKDVVGIFLGWMNDWNPDSEPLLLHGPPGIGKTALVEAYANENGLDMIEVNASDCRNTDELRKSIGRSVSQKSLFKRGKIFLIDEIDGLSGKEDKGGVGEIIKIISETKFPVVMVSNNPYNPKLRELRKYCKLVQFRKIPTYDIEKRLKDICKAEDIKYDDNMISQLAKISNGDLRSAINDLEMLCKGKKEIDLTDLEKIGYRERERSVFDALKILFKTESVLGAKLSIENVDADPDQIFWWIENNIANEYDNPEDVAKAYDVLSKADMFKRRISYRQNWKLMSYMIDMMTAGVSQAKKSIYRKFTKYEYPKNIIILGATKYSREGSDIILDSLSKNLHTSKKKVKSYYLPYLKQMLKNKSLITSLSAELGLKREDIVELLKSK